MPAHVLIVLLLASAALAAAPDPSQWRGPGHDGRYPHETTWAPWTGDAPRRLWRTEIGTGYATVAISEGRAYTVGHPQPDDIDGKHDVVYCLDLADGRIVWQHAYPQEIVAIYNPGGPNATPVVDGRWVYVFAKQGLVICLDKHDGRVRWQRDVAAEHGLPMPTWGLGSVPLILGDRLFLNAGESGLALDKHTGDLVWKSAPGPSGYATLAAVKFRGDPCLAVMGHKELFVVRQADGLVQWRYPWPTKMGENSADPLVRGSTVVVSSWWGMGAAAFDFGGDEPRLLWTNRTFENHISAPVLVGDHLYGFIGPVHRRTTKIALQCVDFKTGQTVWSEPGLVGSLIEAGGRFILLTVHGELIVADLSPDGFKPIARATVSGQRSYAPPVLHDGRLYIRDLDSITCLDLRR